jgi:hypothetical protein
MLLYRARENLKKNKKLFVYNFKEYTGGEDLDGRI